MKGAPLPDLVVTHSLMDDDGQGHANDGDAACRVLPAHPYSDDDDDDDGACAPPVAASVVPARS